MPPFFNFAAEEDEVEDDVAAAATALRVELADDEEAEVPDEATLFEEDAVTALLPMPLLLGRIKLSLLNALSLMRMICGQC